MTVRTKGRNWMECAAWPHVRGDLASTRRGAAAFLDNFGDIAEAIGQQNWGARWTSIGDAHSDFGDLDVKKRSFDKAAEAWLCALTAFEVAKRLVDEDDPQREEISGKVQAAIEGLRRSLKQKVQRTEIPCCDEAGLPAYYLPAASPDQCVPAVIFISREEETGATLLERLLPVVINRGVSILIVSHDDISNRWLGQSEIVLSYCLDYLSLRSDVDPSRIAVCGEGLSAALATDFAVSDRRVAAAVCDGGVWNWVRAAASVGWLTGAKELVEQDAFSTCRSRFVRQLKCPVLVVAGGRGIVSVSEAIKLEAECAAARVDLELAVPRMTRTPMGEIENFVSSDDSIFGWLEHKLLRNKLGRVR